MCDWNLWISFVVWRVSSKHCSLLITHFASDTLKFHLPLSSICLVWQNVFGSTFISFCHQTDYFITKWVSSLEVDQRTLRSNTDFANNSLFALATCIFDGSLHTPTNCTSIFLDARISTPSRPKNLNQLTFFTLTLRRDHLGRIKIFNETSPIANFVW